MVKIDDIKMLRLGQRDENLARDIQMDASDWLELYPGASIQILFRRPGESSITPMISTLIDGTLTWQINDFEVGITGVGDAEIRAVDVNGLRRKSRIIPCSIEETLLGDDATVLYTQDQVDVTLANIGQAAESALAAKASEDAAALSAESAAGSAEAAQSAQEAAEDARDAAQAAQTAAEAAQAAAESSQGGAAADAQAAEEARIAAQAAQASAQGSAAGASASRTAAEAAQAAAETAQHSAETAAGQAQASAGAASESASEAYQSAQNAAQSAASVGQAEQNAAASASAAAVSAALASEKADAASQSATAASGSATQAATSATNAAGSATSASQSATAAQEVLDSIPADYSTLSNDVTDLKSAIGNSLSVGALTENRYINKNTGAISGSSTGSKATGFIPIPPGSKLILTHLRGDGVRGTCFYSSNTEDSFLSAASLADSNDIASVTVTAPDNAKFIRMTGNMNVPDPTIAVVDVVGYIVKTYNTLDEKKLNMNMGASNFGNVLVVSENGDIEPQSVPLDVAEYVSPLIADKDNLTLKGYLNTSTGEFVEAPTSATQRTTDFIELEPFVLYKTEASSTNGGESVSGFRAVILYNNDKSFSRRLTSSDYPQFYLQNNEKYIRINTNADEVHYMRLYKIYTGYQDKTVLLPTIEIPQLKKLDTIPYIHARRPQIGFIIDGEYDKNEDMHDVFVAHGVTCGYAVPWNTDFPNNPLTKYVEWQNEGFEMITHGNYAIPEDYSGSDATAIGYINDSIKRMRANGLYPKGFIGSSGSVAERFIPYIKRLYDWAATVANHATTAESCILFGVDKPYYLWRYGMQLSTLDQQKAAVDRCLSQNGLLLFYGHAKSENTDYFTEENLDALLTYIESVGADVVNPSIGIEQYFAVRYDDIYSLIQ